MLAAVAVAQVGWQALLLQMYPVVLVVPVEVAMEETLHPEMMALMERRILAAVVVVVLAA
jgi:hypothetical protein